ncbi:MAG: LysR family transcriptional regulator [Myxococcota bacterium]
MAIESWNEFRTAFEVAQIGTVSQAAERLGMHRATIMRHIDALEEYLGAKVFHRHPQGYTPTELGRELINAGSRANQVISEFVGLCQLHGAKVDGNLNVAGPAAFGPLLLLATKLFLKRHPGTRVRMVATEQPPRLEHGEAHIFFHVGKKPDYPDSVVQPLLRFPSGVYASREYVEEFGKPVGVDDFVGHRFALISESFGSGPSNWLRQRVEPSDVVFEANTPTAAFRAVLEGIGIGVLPVALARCAGAVPVVAPVAECEVPSWIVTHVDIHRTRKLQAFIQCLRELDTRHAKTKEIPVTRLLAM